MAGKDAWVYGPALWLLVNTMLRSLRESTNGVNPLLLPYSPNTSFRVASSVIKTTFFIVII